MDIQDYDFKASEKLTLTGLGFDDLAKLGCDSVEVINNIKNNFDNVKPDKAMIVERLLTDNEIKEARNCVLEIIEEKLPEHEAKLNEAKAKAAEMVKEAKELYYSYVAQYKEIAKYVKTGVDEVKIDPENIFRISYGGYFIYLLATDSGAKAIKVKEMTAEEIEGWPSKVEAEKTKEFFKK